jgi:polysaccharide deacetylase family protein (PEP-CTERM system associated)
MGAANSGRSIFSVDVEDWFHILALPSTPDVSEWDRLPGRVTDNFRALLDLFSEFGVRVTCFFLGWVGERHPELVRAAHRAGHEVASHGYAHRLAFTMSESEFREDASKAKNILEDVIGSEVIGYRAAGFSVTEQTPWLFPSLAEVGYRYDSSVFPAPREHGGLLTAQVAPHVRMTTSGPVVEFPITVARVAGKAMCFFGGGYLRLFPYEVTRRMARRVLDEGRPVIFYVHPREIDPSHPRLPMGRLRRFKSYVGLGSTRRKVRRILHDFSLVTFREYLAEMTNAQVLQ